MLQGAPPNVVRNSELYAADPDYRKLVDSYIHLVTRRDDVRDTIAILESRVSSLSLSVTQADEDIGVPLTGTVSEATITYKENVADMGGVPPVETDVGDSPYPRTFTAAELKLDDFFSRPVQIGNFTNAVGTSVKNTYDIWNLYFNDPTVRSKLRNYAFIRGDLKVRIVVSGMDFHYGRYILAYTPFDIANTVQNTYNSLARGTTLDFLLLKYYTQVKGSIIIDPRENKPVEFHIPYHAPYPFIRLYNGANTSIGAATSFDDLQNMGQLSIISLNTLKSTSATATPVSFELYATLENVTLAVGTRTLMAVTTEGDERKVGPVQSFASSATKFLSYFHEIPYIGPYAKASSMVSSAFGSVAALFGWSRPIIAKEPLRMRPEAYQNAVPTIGYDLAHRLVFDPQQELSVDPSFVSQDKDELTLKSIFSRYGLLDQVPWTAAAAPLNAIWYCPVTPTCDKVVSTQTGTKNNYQPTPVEFVARAFGYWRGKLKYKLQFPVSKFHRGKIAIVYEPNLSQAALYSGSFNFNKQFITVIDLQETDEIEFCIDWCSATEWNPVNLVGVNNDNPSTTPLDWTGLRLFANGLLMLIPITKLQSNDGSDIAINVFIAGEDLQFNFATAREMTKIRAITQSDESAQGTSPVTCMSLNPTGDASVNHCDHYFGEMPISFRSYLRRFFNNQAWNSVGTSTAGQVQITTTPILPGIYSGVNQTGNANGNLYSYLAPAYAAVRGSVRKRIRPVGISFRATDQVSVRLLAPSTYTYNSVFGTNPNPPLESYGQFIPSVNAAIEVEIPYYNPLLFSIPAGVGYSSTGSNSTPIRPDSYQIVAECPTGTTGVQTYEDCALGEDFMMSYFIAAPFFQS